MKLILVGLNSKYIHTNLAIRYLRNNCKVDNIEIQLVEYTINDNLDNILGELYKCNGDIYCFSSYIWNTDITIKLIQMIKRVLPKVMIILGGPEVSYDSRNWMNEHSEIDFIVKGEGERTLRKLLFEINNENKNFSEVKGIVYRQNNKLIETYDRELIKDLDNIEFPYTKEEIDSLKNKIIYYESSRGCPYRCSYCLSSILKEVRYFSINRVKKDLSIFIESGVKQVKFVDRTFNCNKERTKEIFRYIIDNAKDINFHFEIMANLIDDETIEIIRKAPPGLLQFEIGVQSTNPKTLNNINRIHNFEKLSRNVNKIVQNGNVHIHLDLIAGLPFENYESFKNSFNEVYNLKPHMLQLGFLKFLKGSKIYENIEKFNYKFKPFAPYEVLSNLFLSYNEILKLKDIEDLLEKYSNSGCFSNTLDIIINDKFNLPFDFFESFSEYWRKNNLFKESHSRSSLYKILLLFCKEVIYDYSTLEELLKLDFLLYNKWPLPSFFSTPHMDKKKEKSFEFLKNKENSSKILPKQFYNISAKEIYKLVHFEIFDFKIAKYLKYEIESSSNKLILLFYKDSTNKINGLNNYLIIPYNKFIN